MEQKEPQTFVNPLKTQEQKPGLLKKYNSGKKLTAVILLSSMTMVVMGLVTGWVLSGISSQEAVEGVTTKEEQAQNETEAGMGDTSAFPDESEGVLVKDGIKGEGTHYLDRDLGPDKYVYLTSSVIDLSKFEGKKVHIWGETVSAKHAGWLMDVGRIKVVD